MKALPEVVETLAGPTTVGAGPEQLAELLDMLRDEFDGLGVPPVLAPAVDRHDAVEALKAAGLGAPEEVLVLFGWHDGRAFDSPTRIPRFPYEALGDSLRKYGMTVAVIDELAEEDGGAPSSDFDWGAPRGWLRLWGDNYTVAVDCTGDPAESPLIRATSHDFYYGGGPLRQVVSLCTPITWILDGIRLGGHAWNANTQTWDFDFSQIPPLQRRYGFA